MATPSVVPSVWLGAGYASSSGSHTITLNTNDAASNKTLPQLSDTEADPTTGNAEDILLALFDMAYNAYLARVTASDTPANCTIQKSAYIDAATGKQIVTYSGQFKCTAPSLNVSAE